ncbi:transporter family protein [Mangrovimonas aestuarii]|uniref:hypothetical protein n=1 Tax=Mangrovimonas aestuarii TaxID=3018443 RepID=UPI002378604D|nr:hypothetical protein [Mangrovimonas aestuarii]
MNVFQNIKRVFLVFVLGLLSFQNYAGNNPPIYPWDYPEEFFCDLCGCSTSSGSFGFGTLNNTNFLGARYIYQTFESKDGIFNNSPNSNESFNTYQVWGQVPIYKTFYATAIVPYQDLYRNFEDHQEHIKGLGDINLMGWYRLTFYKKKKEGELYLTNEPEESGHKLQFGIGVKLPTGEFENAYADRINLGFQVGTGSWDGIFSIAYNYSGKRFGLSTLTTYYLKGENKYDYRFGNQFSYSANVFYNIAGKKTSVMPFVGLNGDVYDSIVQYDQIVPNTNGGITNGTLGVEVILKKFVIGGNFTKPIYQKLFGGNVTSKNRMSIYLNYQI